MPITELTISRRFKAGPGEIAFMTNGSGETEIEDVTECLPIIKVEANWWVNE